MQMSNFYFDKTKKGKLILRSTEKKMGRREKILISDF